jgi:hypothetical protein
MSRIQNMQKVFISRANIKASVNWEQMFIFVMRIKINRHHKSTYSVHLNLIDKSMPVCLSIGTMCETFGFMHTFHSKFIQSFEVAFVWHSHGHEKI